jgi:DNA-binding NarL/FixJ family response regulator
VKAKRPAPPRDLAAMELAIGELDLVVFEWPEPNVEPPVRKTRRDAKALSPRETVVAGFLARGFQNLQIAANLGVSVHTIRHQVASILRKTGTVNRTDFAAWWHAQR